MRGEGRREIEREVGDRRRRWQIGDGEGDQRWEERQDRRGGDGDRRERETYMGDRRR